MKFFDGVYEEIGTMSRAICKETEEDDLYQDFLKLA